MKLLFKCANAETVRSAIYKLIEDGDLKTWSLTEIENVLYLKHTQQWGDKGVIKLIVNSKNDSLIAEVFKFKKVTEEVKDFEGYYLGRFCEIILVNFATRFTAIERG